jgi:RecJ-like exonuclease
MRKRCPKCKGTGKEYCPVHGYHICSKCRGKGCIDSFGGGFDIMRIYDQYRLPTKPIRCHTIGDNLWF